MDNAEDVLKLVDLLSKIDPDLLAKMVSEEKRLAISESFAKYAPIVKPPTLWGMKEMMEDNPEYRMPLIDGLLRRGEIMNLISGAKRGKTWMVLDIALSVAAGSPWMGFKTMEGTVVVADNELHIETIAQRLKKVVEARNFDMNYANNLHYISMRGNLKDIDVLTSQLEAIAEPISLVIIDALYRTYPARTDENDNGTMAILYNKLDKVALRKNCAIIVVHHQSKGNQSGKYVTDVGSGAGVFSRATDTHLILRPHEENEAVVLEAVARSFPFIAPRCMRFDYPVWVEAPDLDPADLAGSNGKKKKRPDADVSAPVHLTPKDLVEKFVTNEKKTVKQIYSAVKLAGHGLGVNNVRDMLQSAFISGFVQQTKAKHGTLVYWVGEAELFPDTPDDTDQETPV